MSYKMTIADWLIVQIGSGVICSRESWWVKLKFSPRFILFREQSCCPVVLFRVHRYLYMQIIEVFFCGIHMMSASSNYYRTVLEQHLTTTVPQTPTPPYQTAPLGS